MVPEVFLPLISSKMLKASTKIARAISGEALVTGEEKVKMFQGQGKESDLSREGKLVEICHA